MSEELSHARSRQKSAEERLGAAYGRVTELTGDLELAQKRISQLEARLASSGLASYLADGLAYAKTAAADVFGELQQGKTQRLSAEALKLYNVMHAAAAATAAFAREQAAAVAALVSRELDEHAPGVKPAAAQYWALAMERTATARAAATAHAAAAAATLASTEKELTAFVMAALRKSPATAAYADPVLVQLLVYAVFALPLVLLAFPLLTCLLGVAGSRGSSAGGSGSSSGSGSKKKAKAAAAKAANGHHHQHQPHSKGGKHQ